MLYDDQAAGFDERAAIPAEAVEAVAAAVVETAGLQQGDALLEIGPGTGMLSLPLVRQPIRYTGFDPSRTAVLQRSSQRVRYITSTWTTRPPKPGVCSDPKKAGLYSAGCAGRAIR
jgi:cyclopropane fatty-acyl-phospholipid synthase-like methyltransferase